MKILFSGTVGLKNSIKYGKIRRLTQPSVLHSPLVVVTGQHFVSFKSSGGSVFFPGGVGAGAKVSGTRILITRSSIALTCLVSSKSWLANTLVTSL